MFREFAAILRVADLHPNVLSEGEGERGREGREKEGGGGGGNGRGERGVRGEREIITDGELHSNHLPVLIDATAAVYTQPSVKLHTWLKSDIATDT